MPEQPHDDELLSLETAVYQQADPTADEALLKKLIAAVRQRSTPEPQPTFPTDKRGRMLGADTTGLTVEAVVRFPELPTSIYPLLNPEQDPLLLVHVRNSSHEHRRVRVSAHLEGLSAQAVRTVELAPKKAETLKLSPTLLPGKARTLTTVQWATLHVIADDLDGKQERHDTYPVLCLARTSGFNSTVVDPLTGASQDLTRYYGAWVTPFVAPVQKLIREAANLLPSGKMMGYQRAADGAFTTEAQVRALYQALQKADIAYVHSVISHGAPPGHVMQRTRLPRESLAARSANCLDAVVLMASLLEGASLEPALVFIPRHAFIGWRVAPKVDEWRYLEVSMVRGSEFEAARASGDKQFAEWKDVDLRWHRLSELRAQRIWPME